MDGKTLLCAYTEFIHLFVDGILSQFYNLAILNSATGNMDMQISLLGADLVFQLF